MALKTPKQEPLAYGIAAWIASFALAKWRLPLSPDTLLMIWGAVLPILTGFIRSKVTPYVPEKPPGVRISSVDGGPIAIVLAVLLVACTPAQRAALPVLSTVDALGVTAAQVLGWCEEHDVSPALVDRAIKAAKEKDYQVAFELADKALAIARAEGHDVPRTIDASLHLAQQVIAVQALQEGLRALDGRDKDGKPLEPSPSDPPLTEPTP